MLYNDAKLGTATLIIARTARLLIPSEGPSAAHAQPVPRVSEFVLTAQHLPMLLSRCYVGLSQSENPDQIKLSAALHNRIHVVASAMYELCVNAYQSGALVDRLWFFLALI